MKNILSILCFISLATAAIAQDQLPNIDDGLAVEGYDVVAYFDGKAKEGSDKYTFEIDGKTYKFSSQSNLDKFVNSPSSFEPAYGGWCAYAAATNGDKVGINPETFEIRDGKLYLFYNKLFTNTLKKWLKGDPDMLVKQADETWAKGLK